MKALITGGAGFIGLQLAQKLQSAGYRVDVAENFSRGVQDSELTRFLALPRVTLYRLDVLDAQQVQELPKDYDHIYHFAAIIGVQNVLKRPYAVLADNTLMLLNLIQLAQQQSRLQRFVFTSTSEVYAGTLQRGSLPLPTPETAALTLPDLDHPRTSYMLSKLYGEALLHQAGLPFTIVRPHNFYGPRMGLSHVIPELLKKTHFAKEGGTIDVFSTEHRRTFCFIRDAIELIYRAVESPAGVGQVLNIGTQEPEVTIGELAKQVIAAVGKRLDIVSGPDTPGSPVRRCPDMTRTHRLTGYCAQTSLAAGIQETYRWYRTHVFDGKGISAI